VFVDPEAEDYEYPLVLGGPADGVCGWGKGGECAGDLVGDEEEDQEVEAPLAFYRFGPGGSEVEDEADEEDGAFDDGGEEGGVPEAEAEARAIAAGEEGEVGFVDDEVEEPVAGDAQGKCERGAPVFFYEEVDEAEAGAPDDAHEEAVGDGIGGEVEGEVGIGLVDVDVFDVEEEERGPEEVDPLGCEEEEAEGEFWGEFFCAEADAEMTEDHEIGF